MCHEPVVFDKSPFMLKGDVNALENITYCKVITANGDQDHNIVKLPPLEWTTSKLAKWQFMAIIFFLLLTKKSTPRRPFCVDIPAAVQNEEARN